MKIIRSAVLWIFFVVLCGQPVRAAAVSVADKSVQDKIIAAVAHERKVYGAKGLVPGVLVGVWDADGHEYV